MRRRAPCRLRRPLPGAGHGTHLSVHAEIPAPTRLAEDPPESFAEELAGFLRERADHLVSEAKASLRQARLEHYEKDGRAAMRQRLTALIDVTLSCLATGDATPMIDHTTRIARERFAAGYDLLEVQTSLNIIEEVLWRRILASLPPEQLAHALGLVNELLGLGKDTLARTYVSLALQKVREGEGPEADSSS